MTTPDQIYSRLDNQHKKRQSKFWRFIKICFFIFIILIILMSVFSYKIILSQDSALSGLGRLPVIKQFRQLLGMENLKGELNNRVNFLLLGQGGVGHEGPYLTDTIIFASIIPSNGNLAMISIPRDLFVNIKDYGWYKINSANSLGEVDDYRDGGAGFTAKVVGDIFDLPVHYYLRVDFDAFQQVIDELGGVEVCVDSAFEDPNYPTDDFLTQTISFEAGCQTMDGETALKFVRSRHGTNGEGSDFARAKRQQKIILAVKDKIFTLGTLTNPTRIYNLYNLVKDNIQTNIELAQIPHFLNLAQNVNSDKIIRRVLDNSPSGLLTADISEAGAFILLPRTGDYSELQNLAKNIFVIKNGHDYKPVKLIVLNGTQKEGWARDTAGYLASLNFKIIETGNTPEKVVDTSATEIEMERWLYEKTVIYNLKNSERNDVITVLRKSLDANVTDIVPKFLQEELDLSDADFLVILGCKDCAEEEEENIPNE